MNVFYIFFKFFDVYLRIQLVSVKILYINQNGEIFVLRPRLCHTSECCNKQFLHQRQLLVGHKQGRIGCLNTYFLKNFKYIQNFYSKLNFKFYKHKKEYYPTITYYNYAYPIYFLHFYRYIFLFNSK
ncbi:MAG: hypothetical protein EAZ85_14165 [Bacteroidetes bacterium]|nr:MAG: hypothetical protein EAZ85_14165 [Bacteroidota bacterium]TAG91635.1 MAG: hypothetical protein EAZ20_03145 [Bacteroidota bacterium]